MAHPLVFAYGSNLDLPDLGRWLSGRGLAHLSLASASVASLPDWRLVWNYRSNVRRGGAANVEPAPGAVVWGAALSVDEALLAAFDVKEGHPRRYRRVLAPIALPAEGGGEGILRQAWVYVVTSAYRSESVIPPTRAYLEIVLRGGRALGLPADYLARLAATETAAADV